MCSWQKQVQLCRMQTNQTVSIMLSLTPFRDLNIHPIVLEPVDPSGVKLNSIEK
jgi:hypothetical protein